MPSKGRGRIAILIDGNRVIGHTHVAMTHYKAACIQITSFNNMEANIRRACDLMAAAVKEGADWVLLPENVAMMAGGSKELHANAAVEGQHPALQAFKSFAAEHQVGVLVGSLAISAEDVPGKLYNRSFLLGREGQTLTSYSKIHLYDTLLQNGEQYQESKNFVGGNKAVCLDTEWGKIGLTICYDVRFAYLFRALAHHGAEIITVPAAFTQFTGEAHWHVLLRARAIETGCYILAPAQIGAHPANRTTYGHSLIVSPWGEIIADGGTEEGYVIAEIDTAKVKQVRDALPSLRHDREFTVLP